MSIVSGSLQASAAQSAANKQADAAANSLALQEKMFETEYNDPFNVKSREVGTQALNTLSTNVAAGKYSTPFSMADLEKSPAYQAMLKGGTDTLTAQALASGMAGSGNMATALQNNALGAESTAYGQWMQSLGLDLNTLQSLIGTGQTQVNVTGSAGANYANNASNSMQYGANALAAGQIGQANAYSNMSANAWNQGIGAYNAYNKWNYLNSLNGAGGAAGVNSLSPAATNAWGEYESTDWAAGAAAYEDAIAA